MKKIGEAASDGYTWSLFALTQYIEAAMELAVYDKIEDGTFAGEIPKLPGIAAFGKTLTGCQEE